MARCGLHGWTRLPGGEVLARFHETDPTAGCGSLDLFVVAATRSEAVAKAKALGLHGINLKTNPSPPTNEELQAFLERGEQMLWRRWGDEDSPWLTSDSWPMRSN